MTLAQRPLPEWETLILAIPAFMFFWSAVIASVSLIGGWHTLAKRYPREETTFRIGGASGDVQKFGWTTLKMGPKLFPTNYGNCVTVTLSDDGLGLNVMLPFRPMHPPLLIPWSAIQGCELGKELLLFDRAVIQVEGLANPIRIYGRAARGIQSYWSTFG
jgi:hypothetical protein